MVCCALKILHLNHIIKIFENILRLAIEGYSLEQVNMTEFWLDYDRKIFTTTNINVRT